MRVVHTQKVAGIGGSERRPLVLLPETVAAAGLRLVAGAAVAAG